MPSSMIPSFILYCAVSAITPGPANLCSLSAAMKYGKRQALRQWRGIFFGFAVVALSASAAVWFLGSAINDSVRTLAWIGAAYILWLAYHILRSEEMGETKAAAHCNFFTGFLVQITNVKIMIFCITALATYSLPYAENYTDILKIAALLPFTGPVANLAWLFAGASLRRFFREYQKTANAVMAIALAACAVSIVRS
ncbi:MAG: LysE family transporter [Schwartzia sp.]|nr:LysE family transporter [Schwartzia sp. (in: firmicutes)]MBR1760208.1 LysE family transporter [Schwartzia sp. (in: firmicutes)]MBR1886552.1 LysE family transporter [Schwartzia sp. (in: firmicutes)]